MFRNILLSALAALTIIACEKAQVSENQGEEAQSAERTVSGFAQKGQFVKGSQVTAFAVDKDLVATGESFPATISDDLGAFSITGKTAAPYLELRAEGYYFNEMTGSVSSSPLYLEALVRADDSKANINLMTTAIRPRVKKLIKEGKSYDESVSQAQKELVNAVGFTGSSSSFDDMDITGTTDSDGMLLAFACMIQGGRSAAEVTTLIQEVASDLESTGSLSSTVFDKVKKNVPDVNPFTVIENLAGYYSEKNLQVNNVPVFYKYLDKKYDLPFIIVENVSTGAVIAPANPDASDTYGSIETGLNVLASENFTVEADIEGATVTKEHILGPAYHIAITIPENAGAEDRKTTISFKSASGDILAQKEYEQKANRQYLMITFATNTKSGVTFEDLLSGSVVFKAGMEVDVNGKVYELECFEQYGNAIGVAVPRAESYRVSYPAGKVSYGEHVAQVKTCVDADQTERMDPILYGVLAPYEGLVVNNPGTVYMKSCLSAIRFNLSENIYDIDIYPKTQSEYMAGTATFAAIDNTVAFYGQEFPIKYQSDASSAIHISNEGKTDTRYILTFPQSFSEGLVFRWAVKIKDPETGKVITTTVNEREIPAASSSLRPGYIYSVSLNNY